MLHELCDRYSDGLAVTLYWNEDSPANPAVISVCDMRTGFQNMWSVPPQNALAAFRHPFAFLPAHVTIPRHPDFVAHDTAAS